MSLARLLLQLRTIKYIVDSRGFWSCYLLSIVSVVGYSKQINAIVRVVQSFVEKIVD